MISDSLLLYVIDVFRNKRFSIKKNFCDEMKEVIEIIGGKCFLYNQSAEIKWPGLIT